MFYESGISKLASNDTIKARNNKLARFALSPASIYYIKSYIYSLSESKEFHSKSPLNHIENTSNFTQIFVQTEHDFDEMISFYIDCMDDVIHDIHGPFDAVFGRHFDWKSGSKGGHFQDFEHQ